MSGLVEPDLAVTAHMSAARAAIYFTPPAGDPLTKTAARWLGRDAFRADTTRAADGWLDPLVAEAARYGFHATIRAPFRPAEGCDIGDIDARLAAFAASRIAFDLPDVAVRRLGRFFAIVPTAPSEPLAELEAATLEAFEPYRAPLNAEDIARRRPESLSERQRDNLARWGYPGVLEDFRFHMTLTGPVPEAEAETIAVRIEETFAAFLMRPLRVAGLALFVEPAPGAPFRVHSYHEFTDQDSDASTEHG